MVCLLAAPWVQLSVSAGNGWPHNALRHHWLMPISWHFRDCKALLVTSLTHVSGAIAGVQTFTFTFFLLAQSNDVWSPQTDSASADAIGVLQRWSLMDCLALNGVRAFIVTRRCMVAVIHSAFDEFTRPQTTHVVCLPYSLLPPVWIRPEARRSRDVTWPRMAPGLPKVDLCVRHRT